MIDWLSCSLPYDGPPIAVQFFKRESFDAPVEPAYSRAVALKGSYDGNFNVESKEGRLYLNGNPVKWLSGQNVWGTNDLRKLLTVTLEKIFDELQMPDWCTESTVRALVSGHVKLTRVDCTFAYKVGSDADVRSWLAAMARCCHVRSRGRGHFHADMCALLFGVTPVEGGKLKGSRRSSFKFYNKFLELAAHPPKCGDDVAAILRAQMEGVVRGEACIRSPELKTANLEWLHQWKLDTCLELHRKWVLKMEMPDTFALPTEEEKSLSRHLQRTYFMWRSGIDVRGVISKASFYSHRKQLAHFGIDIAVPRVDSARDAGNVIPILRVLEARPMDETEGEALFWKLAA